MLFVIGLSFSLSFVSFGQNGTNCCPGDGGDPDNPAPLDGGASLLAAAGVAYGAKKIYGLRKKKNQNKDEDLDN